MRRFLLLTISSLLLIGTCGSVPIMSDLPQQLSLEQVFQKYNQEVVEIYGTPKKEGAEEFRYGSGFLIKLEGNQLDVITAKHVVDEDATYRVQLRDGTWVPIVKISAGKSDVALLDLKDREWGSLRGLELRPDPLSPGVKIYVIGSPGKYRYLPTEGNFGLYYKPGEGEAPSGMEDKEFLLFTAPVWFGNSGGPIFDTDGRVCGIVSWMFTQPRHFNFGVPSYVVKSELEKLTK